MIKVYISPSCLSSKKVIHFFEKHNIPHVKRNIIQNPLTESEIKTLLQIAPNGVHDIISSRAKYIKHHAINIENLRLSEVYYLIHNSPTVLKRPIIVEEDKQRIQIGYNEDEIELFLRSTSDNQVNDQYKIF